MRSARADARSRIHRGMLKGITACTRCAHPKAPLGTKGVNTCYPVAKVFPSGWNENTSLYTERSSPEARASASDFNRGPIYRSDAFLEFFTMLNYAVQTARNGIHNNRGTIETIVWLYECNVRGIHNAARLINANRI